LIGTSVKSAMQPVTTQTAVTGPSGERQQSILRTVLIVALILSILYALAVLWLGLFQPLLDQYYQRQTQSALDAYWLLRGSPILAYETPIAGYPWSLPMEFPTYHILAAVLSLTGLPLDAAGRIVSFAFFLGCLWPLRMLFRVLHFGTCAFLFTAIMFVISPIYLYWSRTFIMESCVLFFSLVWLTLFAMYLNERALKFLFGAVAAGSLVAVTKIQTLPAFMVLGGILFLREIRTTWAKRFPADAVRVLALAVLAFVVPLVCVVWWTLYADSVKVHNEWGALLTSQALTRWFFGTLDQRLDWTIWRDAFFARTFSNTFGYAAILAVIVLSATLRLREYAYPALAAMLAFVVPFLLFTNQHVVHTYYQAANAIFIIAAVGLGLASLAKLKHSWIALACLAAIGIGQVLYFDSVYADYLSKDFSNHRLFRIASIIRSSTEPDSSLIVVGNWSSAIPYYAQRKSFVIPGWDWMPIPLLERVLANPQHYLDGARLGGIVYCADDDGMPWGLERQTLIANFLSHRAVVGESGSCQLLAPTKAQP
jgi:hypothetical protein